MIHTQLKGSGIYKIENTLNGKLYIGRTKNFYRRYHQYKHAFLVKNNKHINDHLMNAFSKYGFQNFKFEIIERCDTVIIVERELYWINFYNSIDKNKGYNIRIDVNGKMITSPQTSEKISKRLKKEWATGKRKLHSEKLKTSWVQRDRQKQSAQFSQTLTKYKYRLNESLILVDYKFLNILGVQNCISSFHRQKCDKIMFKNLLIERVGI